MGSPANTTQPNDPPHPRVDPARPADAAGLSAAGDSAAVRNMTSGIARGDEAAFRRFYEAYFDRLHRYLLAASRGWEEGAHDALQDAMMRVVRHARPFHDAAAFWNWLRAVARTALIDQARRRGRTPPALSLAALADPPAPAAEHGDAGELLKDHLSASLETLAAPERALVAGKYFEGKSSAALSREHGLTPKAVESRLARIRKKLKGLILERLEQ